jgi:HNH endonuclease
MGPESFSKMKRKKRYPTLYRCIYCGSNDNPSKLTTEHIIPEGIGGQLEFFRASCEDCQREIEVFEGRLINSTFEGARAILGIASKRSRPRGKVKLHEFDENGTGKRVYVDKSFHQGFQFLFTFEQPKFINDEPLSGKWKTSGTMKSINDNDLYSKDENIYTLMDIWIDKQLDMKRMLAKIAHSYWIAENPASNLTPCLTDFIRGRCEGAFELFVGSAPDKGEYFNDLHEINHGTFNKGDHTYGYVDIHLFSCFPPPCTYRVIVGSVGDPPMHFKFIGENMRVSEVIKRAKNQ